MTEDSIIVAVVTALLTGGGTHVAHRAAANRTAAKDTGRDEASIRREAKMEAAVEALLEACKELRDDVKALRKDKHAHANKLQEHEGRLTALEHSLRVESGPIRMNDR